MELQKGLPHLKVYGSDGKRLFERSGGWKSLAEAVEKALDDTE